MEIRLAEKHPEEYCDDNTNEIKLKFKPLTSVSLAKKIEKFPEEDGMIFH